MTSSSIGDMRQFFMNVQNNNRLNNDLKTLVEELTTGKKTDLTKHLGAGQANLAGIDRQLALLDKSVRANLETGQMLGTMQTALSNVQAQREMASASLLTIQEASSPFQVESAGLIAEQSFKATVLAMNTRFGDRAVFGGSETTAAPLADPETILSELRTSLAGLTSASAISDAIDTYFDTPGGGFESSAYAGDTNGFLSRPSDVGQNVEIRVRADDQAVRDVLKALSKAALASDSTLGLDLDVKQKLQQDAGLDLLTAADPFTALQARLGYVEGQVAEAAVRISAQQTSYGVARNDLVSADPFETATRLEAVQVQLETHYTLTARLSRLSLTEYLR